MVLDTRRNIGNAGLAMAIAYFGANGYTVSVPLNDTQDYDLVVDMGGGLKKIQVKATNSKHSANSYSLLLKTVSGTTRKVYKTSVLFMWRWDNVPYPKSGNHKSEYALPEYIEKQICFQGICGLFKIRGEYVIWRGNPNW